VHSRRQEIGDAPLNTLCDVTQAEGLKALDFLTRKTLSVFKNYRFASPGIPEVDCTVIKQIPDACCLEQEKLQAALIAVCEDMSKKGSSG
jgi:hypothetical protein